MLHGARGSCLRQLVQSRCRAAACLLLLAILTFPVPASAQADIWTATLTVGKFGGTGFCSSSTSAGACTSPSGSLSDDDFILDGTTYTVESIRWGSSATDRLHLTLDRDFPAGSLADLTLEVGSGSFALSAASRGNNDNDVDNNYKWSPFPVALVSLRFGNTITVTLVSASATATSSDATLSALALEDASDDSAIAISPTFASGTTSYTASVLNGVDEITIDPTVNESNATVEYLDSSDTEIADANSGKTGQQVSLDEGANTIKVKVTAQDVTTTNTYTVVVTRAAAMSSAAVLISNIAQLPGTPSSRTRATSFTTGDNNAGYLLSSVDIYTGVPSSSVTPRVEIYENSAANRPGTLLVTLTGPGTIAAGNTDDSHTFNDTSDTMLEGNSRRYWLVVTNDSEDSGTGFTVKTAANATVDSGLPGWYIETTYAKADIRTSAWVESLFRTIFAIKGTVVSGITTSSDATLSALALEDASDDSAITLSPTFAPATTSYAASVVNGVDEITIKPTVNESSATVAYLDGSDAAIADANSGKTGQQVSLSEGANTIKVKVTAQDATTNTYTVVVTRAAANNPPVFADDTASRSFTETVTAVSTAGNVGWDGDGRGRRRSPTAWTARTRRTASSAAGRSRRRWVRNTTGGPGEIR